MFDFSSNGWLRTATYAKKGNEETYTRYFNQTGIWVPTISTGTVELQPGGGIYLVLALVGGVPRILSVMQAQPPQPPFQPIAIPIAEFVFTKFTLNYNSSLGLTDGAYAPPDDYCISYPMRCAPQQPAIQVLDLYRSHNNDTFAHDLRNANTATPAGECYFACNLAPGPYVTHFQVRLDTRYNLYSECTDGNCLWDESFISGQEPTYAMNLGVGREESLGGGGGDGTGQCFTAAQDTGIGYWYSMNVGGMCPFGKSVGWQNCTWEASYKVIKTITLNCSNVLTNCMAVNFTQQGEVCCELRAVFVCVLIYLKIQALLRAFKTCPAVNAVNFAPTPYQTWLQSQTNHVDERVDDVDSAASASTSVFDVLRPIIDWFAKK
jgi:hypothetical protein